ncbi:M28 family peptidase [Gammaproteobacteria bacterium AH-315-C21]|nr:M28 family peptidase [Gammaproteobacteria bacterium AH-315-C21]
MGATLLILVALVLVTMQPVLQKEVFMDGRITVNPDTLQHYVYHLSEELPPRSGDVAHLNQSAEYIFDVLKAYSVDVSYQLFEVDGITHKNVIATFGQRSKKCGTYIIGAHYDVWDGHPGADDNASGIAGLLELARLFSETDIDCPLQLVAYTLEEINTGRKHIGSYHHAQSMVDNAVRVEWMLSLEMIGYFSDEENSQAYPLSILNTLYPSKGDYIAFVGDLNQVGITRSIKAAFKGSTNLPVYSINTTTRLSAITRSDHASYWAFNIPALMVTDTSFNRNPNYHTANDTWDTLDYQRMAKVVEGVYYATLFHTNSHTE